MENQGKIKIKRSNGQVQYVTRDELEKLNYERKRRDQAAASSTSTGPFVWLIALSGFSLFVVASILWLSN